MATLDGNNNIIVTPADIREIAPEFASTTDYPDSLVNVYIDIATAYITNRNIGDIGFKRRATLIKLMAAHLLKVAQTSGEDGGANAGGGVVGQKTSASVGQVSVSVAIPKTKGELDYFLNQTEYGLQYAALLSALTSPLLFGGSFQRVL